jgi:predicted XRE-type DNA-binding protein
VSPEVRERLAKAARETRDLEEAWRLALEHRDAIVVEAIDVHHMAQSAVAEAIGVAKGRVSAILASSQPDAGEA